ncbi:BREX-2 system adenine-specific DNA-methyltransferase PglX [Parafrankia elaeagni]|uniref:BREX-2 system adenine-specific DNA-methyltransferase PglX n=1 Tax=Parafrankia elaeagni TaxID=222534 RepID=UPI00039EA118|nr:BREX-2 system adenine-specific DNA-methyltransferase PglX [Parafrankia elaeagni]
MIDRVALLKGAKQQVKVLEKDLEAQVDAVPEVGARLLAEYDRAFKVGRTAATWKAWLDERVTQAAVAWVLGTVFVRFCEDNGLIGDPYLAGPEARLTLAEERLNEFYVQHPELTARDWLLAAFGEISKVPVGAGLFDERHNALFQIPLTHDTARDLITFWRTRQSGELVHDFTDPDWGTRFLGDLYQDLSEDVRDKYALLQTPEFVEEFILDLTLTPAIEEFGYDAVRMIDPTCGSGHFLLGAFHRLRAEWEKFAPEKDAFEQVSRALDAVHGVDINPYAAAIAKFRLIVAALRAAEIATLDAAAGYNFPLHVAVGDSLLKGRQLDLFGEERDELAEFSYSTEDLADHLDILNDGRYHAVVGNPPYMPVKDKTLNGLYRELYSAASGKYQMTVPFAQRFFELALQADIEGRNAGRVGQILANAFMKRKFGTKLIEDFFASKVELTHVIDTSGAYIPGPGVTTVILAGRRNRWNRSRSVRAILGKRGEPTTPANPAEGLVWRAIVEQIDSPGSESLWISATDVERQQWSHHPWSVGGGGATELLEFLDETSERLGTNAKRIGVQGMTNADDVMLAPSQAWRRRGVPQRMTRELVIGEDIRDWSITQGDSAFFPYEQDFTLIPLDDPYSIRWLWPTRTTLGHRATFSKKTYFEEGRSWHSWHQLTRDTEAHELTISLSFISTHNNFFLDRDGRVFKQSATVVKMPAATSENEHLGLLGVLNSSTACFWFKQVCHSLGSTADSTGARRTADAWENFYEYAGTKVQNFPLPAELPLKLGKKSDEIAQNLTSVNPTQVVATTLPTRSRLAAAKDEWTSLRARIIAFQEELDWQVYRQYGLLADELTLPITDVPEIELGERAFEIVLARKIAAGEEQSEWFNRHGSTPVTEVPMHWPAEYRALVEKRISAIETDRNIGLIERPEYKRRWATGGWDKLQDAALRDWLLDRLETRDLWFADVDGMVQPRLWTTGQLADELAADADFVSVAEFYRPGEELTKVVAALVEDEHVPFLAALRYTDNGLAKWADWESVWDQQRAEDAAPTPAKAREIRDAIPVPRKYTPKDFRKTSFWRARGKLDVPKERFISYQPAGRDNDPTLLIGWAGFDHREQAQALATLIVDRRDNDGWDGNRLTPLVAGLREVMPWVRQWHNEIDPLYDGSPAEVYDAFLADTMGQLNLTEDTLTSWRPPAPTRGRRPTK